MSNIISISKARSRKRHARSLEYELIASLTLQQYAGKEGPDFNSLLSIPVTERIPGLIKEYGMKKMFSLVRTVLQEFTLSVKIPGSKKLNETRTSALACDLILVAEEDHLSMEDLVIFFELARQGHYGSFGSVLTHYRIMEMLELYRNERYKACIMAKVAIEARVKISGPSERISPQPTLIKHLFEEGKVVPFKKII